MHYSLKGKKVFVAGHRGMVGSAVSRRLAVEDCEILTVDRSAVDLRNMAEVNSWMQSNQPDVVVLAAAKVGGIHANASYPVEFLQDNLMIQNSVISASHNANVERLLFLGSSCIYPKHSGQPITEDALLTGPLELTNEPYAIAKIAGIKLTQAYRKQYGRDWISAMPTNLYGPGDNYHPLNSHVLPALLRRFHEAKSLNQKSVKIWGSGSPMREFMHCDDLADALVYLLKHYSDDMHINVGTGDEVSIKKLAELISQVVGGEFDVEFDRTKPDGTPRKLMNNSRLISLGWKKSVDLENGIRSTYADFLEHLAHYERR